jgi:hypothetical protein
MSSPREKVDALVRPEDLEKLTDFMKRMNERIDSQRRKVRDEEKTKGWK